MANIIAIVGRPNVGKSTLFNRLVESREAIMDDQSGVTRDRHYGHGEWSGYYFTVIDTGGYVSGSEDVFEEAIRQQVKIAINEADVILFMVDLSSGLTGLDEDFARVLRKSKKPVKVIVNKADEPGKMNYAGEFYRLGFDEVLPISAANGSGTGELLDSVIASFKEPGEKDPFAHLPKIAIMGRPNVGKSSLLNVLLGENRSIVTDIAGTTRDSVNSFYKGFGHELLLMDTAGLRKKSKVSDDIEFYSVLRSVKALEDSDVCIVMIDATRGFEAQDMSIISLAERNKKGILILVNKWDLVGDKSVNLAAKMEKEIREKMAPIDYVPIMFVSVLEKQRIIKALEKAVNIYEKRKKRISTAQLNQALLPEIERSPPPVTKGKNINIKFIMQLPTHTPVFAFFCNLPQYVKAPYERFLENKLREHFDLEGVPVKIVFRNK